MLYTIYLGYSLLVAISLISPIINEIRNEIKVLAQTDDMYY